MDSTRCNNLPNQIFRDLLMPSLLFWIFCLKSSSKITANFGSLFLMIKSCYFISISSHFGWFDQNVDAEATYFILNSCKWPKRRCTKNIGLYKAYKVSEYDFNLNPFVLVLLKYKNFKQYEKCEIFKKKYAFRT